MKRILLLFPLFALAATYTKAQCSGSNISTGMVAEYDFTGNGQDSSGNNNNGIVYGCTLVPNRFGTANSAYSFNGTSDSIVVPNSSSLQFTSDNQSISFWFNVPSLPNPSLNNEAIISKMNENLSIDPTGNSAQGFYIVFGESGGGTIYYSIKSGSSSSWATAIINSSLLSANIWENACFIFNSTKDSVYAYLNGALVNQAAIPSGTTIGQNSLPLLIGNSYWTSNGNPSYLYNGILDDIRIYNKALNPCEVDSVYNMGANTCAGISEKYTLDSVATSPNWSYTRIALPEGAQLDSIYGGIERPGYSGPSLSFICNYDDSINLLNTTTSYYNPYTGPYMAWINTTSYNIIGGKKSYVQFSITQSNGMVFDSAMIAYSCPAPTSVNNITATDNVKIYPNPTSSLLHIQSSLKLTEITVSDLTGRMVYDGPSSDIVDLSRFASGCYFITLKKDDKIIDRYKVIKY